jgi:PAS domain S-box-containing protein
LYRAERLARSQNYFVAEGDLTEDATPGGWFTLYKQAMLEVDPSVLAGRIQLAKSAIQARLVEFSGHSEHVREEGQRLQDALRNLVLLEREPLAGSSTHQLPATRYVVLADRDRRWLAFSESVCELLGYPRAELLGRQIDELAAPELQPTTKAVFEEFVSLRSMDGVYALIHKDGHRVNFHYKARVFPDGAMIAFWYPDSQ